MDNISMEEVRNQLIYKFDFMIDIENVDLNMEKEEVRFISKNNKEILVKFKIIGKHVKVKKVYKLLYVE